MRNHKTHGIVLHKRLIGDQDMFVTIMTQRFGRLDAIAKGSKKITSKFVSSLDVLNLCEFELYKGPKTWIIREAKILESFQNVKTKLERSRIAHTMITLIYRVAHGQDENQEDFFLLKQSLIELIAEEPDHVLEKFEIRLLKAHGLLPNEPLPHRGIIRKILTHHFDLTT